MQNFPNKSANKLTGKLRIVGGTWRSRVLRFVEAEGLRPTPDRVRETLFNWLGQELHGLHCLDLFAGSGALGFEAASRGAASVVMVENNAQVHRTLLDNAKLLNAGQIQIERGDALSFLSANQQKFDVIFLDPPFHQQWLEKLLPQLAMHLADNGVVYVEAESPLTETLEWQLAKQGKAGAVHYHLLKYGDGT
ncbi:MAG: 16S rRNA (guanine(966)-N(2))-methyltransferase RsmD [Methylophilaceae bacterium]